MLDLLTNSELEATQRVPDCPYQARSRFLDAASEYLNPAVMGTDPKAAQRASPTPMCQAGKGALLRRLALLRLLRRSRPFLYRACRGDVTPKATILGCEP